MASTKRKFPSGVDPQHKKPRISELESYRSASGNLRVVLNPADCDIDFNVEGDGLQCSALYEDGFAYCWSGARANIGIIKGKYCFGCKVISSQPVDMEDTPLDQQHVCRVGVSRGDDALRNLGETMHSFGYGGTGKFSNSGTFSAYGEKFGVGDTIVCCVDLESRPMASISFSKNGKWFGIANHFDAGPSGLAVGDGSPIKKLRSGLGLFPHVLLKNVIVKLQFTIDDGLIPVEGYKPWNSAILDDNMMFGPTFLNPNDCEVIVLVGLPASGKTTWAEKQVTEHPEKRYVILGTNLALDQMKVPGLLRKHNYSERFDRLMDRATKIFNVLLSRASRMPRNFIIDQTNVYKSARKRKLKPFANFIKIAVVVFPRMEELKFRADKRFKEMGKEVPAEAINEMSANFTLPTSKDMPMTDEYFDQVLFVELDRVKSQRTLDEMKRELNSRHHQKSPVHSYTSPSHHNKGSGDCNQSYFSNPSYESRIDCDYTGNFRGYVGPTGAESGHFLHKVARGSIQINSAPPYPRAPSSLYKGRPYDVPHPWHSEYQSSPPIPYGSCGTLFSRPRYPDGMQQASVRPHLRHLSIDRQGEYGNVCTYMQQSGEYPRPSPPGPPVFNFQMDVHRPGPPPPRRYE